MAETEKVLDRNIHALLEHRNEKDRLRTRQERVADAITAFAGSMTFVYVHLAIVVVWVAINLGWTPLSRFDPTFVILATAASVEAIFLSTFVLITQNRMAAVADRRADLDVQISLLTEHELTRLITVVAGIAQVMGVSDGFRTDVNELKQDVQPEHVLKRIEGIQQDEG